MFDGKITLGGIVYKLDYDHIFQRHIPMSMNLFCELLDQDLPMPKFELSNNILIFHCMTTEEHDAINMNLFFDCMTWFRNDDYYKVCSDSLAVSYPNADSYYLPDATVVIAKDVQYMTVGEERKQKAISNAIAILEILSDGTEKYDRTEKYKNYQKIPSLKQFTLISQKKIQVENFVKNASGEWSCKIYTQITDSFSLVREEYKILLSNLYRNTSLVD